METQGIEQPKLSVEQEFRLRFIQDTVKDLIAEGRQEELLQLIDDILRDQLKRENYLMSQLRVGWGL